jgi:pimeloyl-ACP methyl ester carboxylesterase
MTKKQKKTVLVLHGFPGLSQRDSLRKYLSQSKFDVVLPDLFDINYIFDIENIIRHIDLELKGRIPDAILAFSLGGLIAPYVAVKFPKAKLVMTATGPNIQSDIGSFNYVLQKFDGNLLKFFLKIIPHIPFGIYKFAALTLNPYKSGNKEGKTKYYHVDIPDTHKMLVAHSPQKLYEIIQFVKQNNNTEILKKLRNKTLIISGANDHLMPPDLSVRLNNLIKNSKLIINKDRLHFEVFDERDFEKLDNFIFK